VKTVILILFLLSNSAYAMQINWDTQLLEAASHPDRDRVEHALKNGANVNAQDTYGWTALNLTASLYEAEDLVEYLLEAKADVTLTNDLAQAPLHQGVFHDNLSIVKLLVGYGADMHSKSTDGKTPLTLSKEQKSIARDNQGRLLNNVPRVTGQFLEAYAPLLEECTDKPTRKTLKKAVNLGASNIVRLLLGQGIIPMKKHLDLAKKHNYKEIGFLLRKYLGISSGELFISKSGIKSISSIFIPQEVAEYIARYVL
jgi:ankyrin repeat protein